MDSTGLSNKSGHAHIVRDRLHRVILTEQPPYLGREMYADVRIRVFIKLRVHDLRKTEVMPARELEIEHDYFVPVLLQLERKMGT